MFERRSTSVKSRPHAKKAATGSAFPVPRERGTARGSKIHPTLGGVRGVHPPGGVRGDAPIFFVLFAFPPTSQGDDDVPR